MLISLSLMRQRSSLNMLKASWKLFVKRSRHVKKTDRYLYWSKDKKESENSVTATYMSCEKVKCCSSQEFASDLLVNLTALREHGQRMISQYRRIKEINKIAPDHSQKSLYFRVDWSQNWNFFHARQEKWAYYHELQVLINAVVAYMSTNVSSHCTISDAKSHKAPAVWALLEKILGSFDLDRLQVLYIITDSPTSQYRNKYNTYLTKKCAIQHNLSYGYSQNLDTAKVRWMELGHQSKTRLMLLLLTLTV